MAGITDLVGFDFPPGYTSSAELTPTFNGDGTLSIPDPGIQPISDKDSLIVDSEKVVSIDLTPTATSPLGTIVTQETSPFGLPVGLPATSDIVGVNGNSILLGLQPFPYPEYILLSNVDISAFDNITASNPNGDRPSFPITMSTASVSSYVAPTAPVPCFGRGTAIATPAGEKPVELLEAGDMVVTASGAHETIVWAGTRSIDIARHPDPDQVRPVRIAAGAFADNIPARDLTVSADHNIFAGGVLIPAKCLVNGTTVVQLDVAEVHYHHIELARHDIVLAEGLTVETYLDTGNRRAFVNLGSTILHPDFASSPDVNYFAWESNGCAPLRLAGPAVEDVRAQLAQRAADPTGCHEARDVAA